MNERTEDDARELDALRALDPSAGARAPQDLHRRIAEIPEPDKPQASMDRRAWFAAAAATIAIVAAGIGFALSPTNDAAVVALTRPASGEVAPAVHLASDSASESAGASADSVVLSPQSLSRIDIGYWGGWGGRQHFTVPAFDTSSGQATVYALDGSPYFNIETISRIAAIFGVPGDAVPNEHGGGWTVGNAQNGGPIISLSSWGRSEIWFNSGLESPVSECVAQIMNAQLESEVDWDSMYEECQRATPQPTEEQARAWMGIVLDAFGIEENSVTLEVLDDGLKYENTLTVLASRVVDGMATPISIYMTVSHEGILHAGGSLGELVPLGAYQVVSPAAAAERLNTSAFSPDLTHADWLPGGMSVPESEPPAEPAPLPAAGSPIPWSVSEHEIVSARLGLAAVYGTDWVTYVVPAYEFTDGSGNRWSVIALAEEDLTLTGAW